MKWLIWTIRSAFCKHDWDFDEQPKKLHDGDPKNVIRNGIHVSMLCKKCGWHRSFWKH
jgi:hypothetical protein